MPNADNGWLPDLVYRNGRFESGVALFSTDGKAFRFSSDPEDLRTAERLAGRAILPGLVNAHSHAFQRAIRARTEHRTKARQDSFWTWREAMYHAANRLSPEDIYDVSRMAFLEMLTSGITTVGEFHYLHHGPAGEPYGDRNLLARLVIQAARDTGLRIVLLRTAYARAGFRTESNPGQARFLTEDFDVFVRDTDTLADSFSSSTAWVGVAPHSLRAVPLPYLLKVVSYARKRNIRIHMHVAEQPAEIAACQAEHGLRPVELLARHGIPGPDFTAIHATHATPEEIGSLSHTNICVCPTTERNLGDGTPAADLWAAAGINVAFGSDSNIQIDLLEDARELEYHLRLNRLERALLQAPYLFDCATVGGARSLGVSETADFFTLDLDHPSVAGADPDSLLAHVVFAAQRGAIRDVYVGGTAVLVEGHHRDEDVIIQRFAAVQRRLWS